MMVFINPGTGVLPGATKDQAVQNMMAFTAEASKLYERPVEFAYLDKDDGQGRWSFEVTLLVNGEPQTHEVDMPGLPLAQVKARALTQPRLYVDGSSWYWPFALGMVEPRGDDDE